MLIYILASSKKKSERWTEELKENEWKKMKTLLICFRRRNLNGMTTQPPLSNEKKIIEIGSQSKVQLQNENLILFLGRVKI